MLNTDQARFMEVRTGPAGHTLSEHQFRKAYAYAETMESEIQRTGSFIEPLSDHGHLLARGERFDALGGEAMIRDVYKARYGVSMNQRREALLANEQALGPEARQRAFEDACAMEAQIRDGETMPYYRASDQASVGLARDLEITERGALNLMKTVYAERTGRDLYEDGKSWEASYHAPVRDAARQERARASEQRADQPLRSRAYSR